MLRALRLIPSLAIAALLLLTLWAPHAAAQASPYTPARGSAERRQISDALRAPVQQRVRESVIFEFDHLRVQHGWAFVSARPTRPDGGRPAYFRSCGGDQLVFGLLRWVRGRWTVVAVDQCMSDVSYLPWARQHGAPRSIFPHPQAMDD